MSTHLVQGSEEWLAARLGKLTASRLADATTKTAKGWWGASRTTLINELLTERFTGKPFPRYVTPAMSNGTKREPFAREQYEIFFAKAEVTQVGFVDHPTIGMAGASPDGLVGSDGLLEIKCPEISAHMDFAKSEKIPEKYIKQMMWQLACMPDRTYCDFLMYNPDAHSAMQLLIQRVPRDDKMIASLEKAAIEFLAELDAEVAWFRDKFGIPLNGQQAE